ncbi:NAD(P)/FAD-dependent oxidoreductase [Granulicoccus phenolivorans]|uniref:NAD(P)/FAD-dependent oxidoreductase n=1 Tax=Granulicoccus phenolivorans TaxID=266854 RepID=UPI000B12B54B|nr:FAD-dependent oxidoreductase [Granulicoccus phenolivorans]
MKRLVVVGASLAGLRAVEAARKQGCTGELVLIGDEAHLPYDRPPLSKGYLNRTQESVVFRTEEVLRDELKVDLRLGVAATGLDPIARVVQTSAGPVAYDALIIATGARARMLPGVPAGLRGVHLLRTLDDADAVRAGLDAGARVVVIGAGFIGSEIAAAAVTRGLNPTLVEALPTPLVRAVGQEVGEQLATLHRRKGLDLRTGVGVAAIEGEGSQVARVRLSDGTVLAADLVVLGIGAIPNTEWLQDSGLTLDNGVVCDATMRAADGVYAAGDVVRWENGLFAQSMRLEHWTSAAEQAATAVRNALSPDSPRAYETVPYFWSDWYDVRVQFVGVPEADETLVVEGDLATGDRLTVLYRLGDRLNGVLTVNGQADIMKYRRMIGQRATWAQGLEFAAERRAMREAKAVAHAQ